MKVYFGCTSAKLLKYIDIYKLIRNHLIQKECVILFDWLEHAEKRIKENHKGKRNIKKIYKKVLNAINKADIVVIENTVPNFSVAHQINYAVMRRKPILVLWQQKDNEGFTDSYLEAIESKYLTIKKYQSNKECREIISKFMGYSKIEFGQKRYNIVLGNKQRYYLDWASNKYNKSRSEIIREAIDKISDIDKDFAEYIKYPTDSPTDHHNQSSNGDSI